MSSSADLGVEVTQLSHDTLERLPGAYRTTWGNRWFSMVKYRGRRIYLGTFATQQEAHEAYLNAKRAIRRP